MGWQELGHALLGMRRFRRHRVSSGRLKRLLGNRSFILHLPYPSWLRPLIPSVRPLTQVNLLLSSARPCGSTAICHTALDCCPPWPFSQLLVPIPFPRVFPVTAEATLSDECRSSSLPWAAVQGSSAAFSPAGHLGHVPRP